MKYSVVLLILSISLSSCSSSIQLSPLSEEHRKFGKESAKICLRSGQIYGGEQIRVGTKSIWFMNQDNDSLMQIPAQDLDYIYVSHHVAGAFEGFLIGGAFGVSGGYVGTMLLKNGSNDGKGLVALVLGTFGSLIGLVVGAAKGHEYYYIIPQDSSAAISNNQTAK